MDFAATGRARRERGRHERFLLFQTTPFNLFNSRATPLDAGLSISASLPSRRRSYPIAEVFALEYTWRQLSGAGFGYGEAKSVLGCPSFGFEVWRECRPFQNFNWDSQSPEYR